MKANGCMLVGEPDYYNRFGFKQASELTIEGVPPINFMVFPIELPVPKGLVEFHPAFGVGLTRD